MGMREPETGISESTDSHVFFCVLLNQGKSIGLIYMDYAEERKINREIKVHLGNIGLLTYAAVGW